MPGGWRWMALTALGAGILLALPPSDPVRSQLNAAYYSGQSVSFSIAAPEAGRGRKQLRVGPWALGTRVADSRPRDRRRNLYLVFPGRQYHAPDGWQDYDVSCILSAVPETDEPVEWDVYWAVILDPTLGNDFRDERDLILADQARFGPADLLEFDDLPGERFLQDVMKMDSLDDLARFRHKDGTLPRAVIVPAGFAIRASAKLPQSPAQ